MSVNLCLLLNLAWLRIKIWDVLVAIDKEKDSSLCICPDIICIILLSCKTVKKWRRAIKTRWIKRRSFALGNLYKHSTPFYGTLNQKRFSLQMTMMYFDTTSTSKYLRPKSSKTFIKNISIVEFRYDIKMIGKSYQTSNINRITKHSFKYIKKNKIITYFNVWHLTYLGLSE